MIRTGLIVAALLAATASATINVGDTLPSVTLDYGFPPEKVNVLERAKGKNVILMGLPGAFTPT
jgi:peroxiredoxin